MQSGALALIVRVSGFLLGLGVSLWTVQPQQRPAQSCGGVRLEIAADSTSLSLDERPRIRASLINESKRPISLVRPGDGSSLGWRTPIVGWSVLKANDRAAHPPAPPPERGARDGNINPLTGEDLLRIEPGTSQPLGDWVGAPSFSSPGSYRVVFYYRNVPDLTWKGIPLGQHDPAAMKQLAATASCSLVSNELNFSIR